MNRTHVAEILHHAEHLTAAVNSGCHDVPPIAAMLRHSTAGTHLDIIGAAVADAAEVAAEAATHHNDPTGFVAAVTEYDRLLGRLITRAKIELGRGLTDEAEQPGFADRTELHDLFAKLYAWINAPEVFDGDPPPPAA